jgi:methyl-accepting chemotaxis protein
MIKYYLCKKRRSGRSILFKKVRQKYFVSKELRISISLIILWSLLVTAFFTFIAKEIGGKIGHGTPLFIVLMVGYAAIVVVLTMLFSHRLLGPFQRLMTEIRLILSGDYRRRLNVRKNDDIYIRSFVSQVNKLLEEIERMKGCQKDMIKQFDSELLSLISVIEENDQNKEKMREAVLSLHKKLKEVSDRNELNP